MNKENVSYMHSVIFSARKKKEVIQFFSTIDRTGGHYAMWSDEWTFIVYKIGKMNAARCSEAKKMGFTGKKKEVE